MKNISNFIMLTFLSLILSSCNGNRNKQDILANADEDEALIGDQSHRDNEESLVVVGTLAGSLVDNEFSEKLNEHDKEMMIKTSQQALEFSVAGNRVEWRNPDNKNTGFTTPIKALRDKGRYCREYIQEIKIGGKTQKAYGTACRNHSGKWELI